MNTKGMKAIGKGAFSSVYQITKKKVLIKSVDSVKECMANGWFPDTPLFPKLERVGSSECGLFQFYEEKFYQKVKGLKKNISAFEYEFYICLRELSHFASYGDSYYEHWRKEFNSLPAKFHHKKRMLLDALDALVNYGDDICFEISPRNVAIQGEKLVLLDCFFFQSELKY